MVMSFIGMSFLKRGGEGQVELFLGPILEHVKRLKSVVEVCFEFAFNLIGTQAIAFLKEPS